MEYLICENELDAAIQHLKNDTLSYAAKMPGSWSKTWLLAHIREVLNNVGKPAIGTSFQVMYNVWAHIEPVGVDLLRYPRQAGTLQIMLSFRTEHTQPEKLVLLGER